METPGLLRDFAGRNGWLVAANPWRAFRIVELARSSVHVRLLPDVVTSLEDWTLEVLDDRNGERRYETHGDRAACARRAATVLGQLNTVSELRNLRKPEQIQEALDTLGHWAIQVARVDVGLPREQHTRLGQWARNEIVERLLSLQRA